MRSLELRVPPLAVLFVTALLMMLSAWAVPGMALSIPFQELVALGFALVGNTFSVLGVLSFGRAGTTVNPLKPDASSSLVCSGVYTLSRNPMYLGFLMLLLGWASYLSNAVALLFVPMFLLYMNKFQIEPEERALTARFGQEFMLYKMRVRRWL